MCRVDYHRLHRALGAFFAGTRCIAAFLASLSLHWLAIPFRITEMMMGFHEIVDSEVILTIVKPGAAPDDLLELDHRIHRPH